MGIIVTRMIPWRLKSAIIDLLFNTLLGLTKIIAKRIFKWDIDPSNEGLLMRKSALCHDIFMEQFKNTKKYTFMSIIKNNYGRNIPINTGNINLKL